MAAGTATLAWTALRDDDEDLAERRAREALELWKAPSAFPFEWLARWPLVTVAERRGALPEATHHLTHMLDPGQQLLPDSLTRAMVAAVEAAGGPVDGDVVHESTADGGGTRGADATGATAAALLRAVVQKATALNYS